MAPALIVAVTSVWIRDGRVWKQRVLELGARTALLQNPSIWRAIRVARPWQRLCEFARRSAPEDTVQARDRDEWTIARWRREPRWRALDDVDEPQLVEQAPPLWKDLTVATVAAVLLWGAAVVLFG